jgi:hypothetical protein
MKENLNIFFWVKFHQICTWKHDFNLYKGFFMETMAQIP